jgi:hypothetical protein
MKLPLDFIIKGYFGFARLRGGRFLFSQTATDPCNPQLGQALLRKADAFAFCFNAINPLYPNQIPTNQIKSIVLFEKAALQLFHKSLVALDLDQ